jgi:hypothetical protein
MTLLCYNLKIPVLSVTIFMKSPTPRDSNSRYGPKTLLHLLRTRAEEVPDRLAFRFIHDHDSEIVIRAYGELDRRARAIGAWLESFEAWRASAAFISARPGLHRLFLWLFVCGCDRFSRYCALTLKRSRVINIDPMQFRCKFRSWPLQDWMTHACPASVSKAAPYTLRLVLCPNFSPAIISSSRPADKKSYLLSLRR